MCVNGFLVILRTVASVLVIGALTACGPDHTDSGPRVFTRDAIPDRLSEWGIFEITEPGLQLDDAVWPYELATPLFSDYAMKLRTLWLPAGTSANYTEQGVLDFPVGTVISKTFYYPRLQHVDQPAAVLRSEQTLVGFEGGRLNLEQVRLIETRLLVHQSDGWQALPYVWNEDNTEASLQITGAVLRLQLHDSDEAQSAVEPFAYVVPNRNECGSCHIVNQNNGKMSPIGPSARNLNRPSLSSSLWSSNQLDELSAKGWLQQLPAETHRPSAALWQAGALDNLELRARSYLDVNCAHCHQSGGSGDTSGLFLNFDEPWGLPLGVCKPPVAAGRGSGGNLYSIVPGHPGQSILSYRIQSNEVGVLMPEVGRSVTHQSGLLLINTWIEQQEGLCH
jgi:uncharacterized repeat protein (TIGR03806 family)